MKKRLEVSQYISCWHTSDFGKECYMYIKKERKRKKKNEQNRMYKTEKMVFDQASNEEQKQEMD